MMWLLFRYPCWFRTVLIKIVIPEDFSKNMLKIFLPRTSTSVDNSAARIAGWLFYAGLWITFIYFPGLNVPEQISAGFYPHPVS